MAAATQDDDNNTHPREWHVYYSKVKQREYYFDPISQETTWVLPADANRVTKGRTNNDARDSSKTLGKLCLLGAIFILSIWLSTGRFPFSDVVQRYDNNQSASSEPRIIKNQPAGKDSDASSTIHHPIISSDQFPKRWKKVLEKEIPHDQELDRLAKNIEAALQSSEDLLKKIVADAKEAGMEIKSSAFTH